MYRCCKFEDRRALRLLDNTKNKNRIGQWNNNVNSVSFWLWCVHCLDNIDSRFGLSVGSLFAVIGNKYIIDSSLPETTTFTLVDTLHGITLVFIFAVITATAYSIQVAKKKSIEKANRFDMIIAQILLAIYLILNYYFISQAQSWSWLKKIFFLREQKYFFVLSW